MDRASGSRDDNHTRTLGQLCRLQHSSGKYSIQHLQPPWIPRAEQPEAHLRTDVGGGQRPGGQWLRLDPHPVGSAPRRDAVTRKCCWRVTSCSSASRLGSSLSVGETARSRQDAAVRGWERARPAQGQARGGLAVFGDARELSS